ncbi:hypothetical protein [Alkanindiges illinoisensis]|uniref:hypothetical protein n=1 Tax=Alkanindiges illinoisensis TaxID=197183 RepID=UPI00068602DD|nr:hypothetical protein [Alkanindiges illinoisensis]
MSLNDLVFWLGFIIGIALVLICTGILRYLKPSRTYDKPPFVLETFPMPSYSPLEALREDIRKLHGKFDELFKPYVTGCEKYKPGLEELSRKWAKPEVKPSIVPQTDLKTSLAKAGLDKLTPVAKTKIADLDGETIYEDADGRRVLSPTSVEISGEKYKLLAGRTYMVDVNELRTIDIEFQAGNPAVNGVNGLTNELLLAILIDRTKVLDSEQPCDENKLALDYMQSALECFQERIKVQKHKPIDNSDLNELLEQAIDLCKSNDEMKKESNQH